VNDLGSQLQDNKELGAKYPGTAFILILQHIKVGHFPGKLKAPKSNEFRGLLVIET
jgi:hypothetical protein